MRLGMLKVAALLALLLTGACDVQPIAGPVPAGTWGGQQGNLAVFPDSATLDMPCAIARIPEPLVSDSAGRFDLPGYWAVQAGPIGIEGAHWQPARFAGVHGEKRIEMIIQLENGTKIGPLTFERDVIGHFPRCL